MNVWAGTDGMKKRTRILPLRRLAAGRCRAPVRGASASSNITIIITVIVYGRVGILYVGTHAVFGAGISF